MTNTVPTVKLYRPAPKMPEKHRKFYDRDMTRALAHIVGTDILVSVLMKSDFVQIPGTNSYQKQEVVYGLASVHNRVKQYNHFVPDSWWKYEKTGLITDMLPGILDLAKSSTRVYYTMQNYQVPTLEVRAFDCDVLMLGPGCLPSTDDPNEESIRVLETMFGKNTLEMQELRDTIKKKTSAARGAWNRKIKKEIAEKQAILV